MKKFSKILIFALSLVIAVSAFAIASSANTSPFLVEGLYRETWEEAVENAYIKGDRIVPVELLRDYEAAGESVEITESVVVSLNGHTLKSETGTPLFTVSGKDTTLTIVGPGTIYVNGTLANVEGGTLVLDARNTLKVTSEGGDSAFAIGGEEKTYATVLGALDFESAGADLFEMSAGSKLEISDGNAVNAKPTDSAKGAFGIAFLHGNSKASVSGGASLSNLDGGYIFKVDDEAGIDTPVAISCENATLISDSTSYGSIIEAGSGYAEVSVRLCEVLASGAVFTADNTLSDFEGEGKDKIYAKPTLSVNFTASVYNVSENENSNASLFFGNVTGVVTASEIWKSENSSIAIGTRLWDGECGVLIKYGCKIFTTASFIESELEAPITDKDGAVIYFNPASATNKNFSLDTINGEACRLYKKTEIGENNSVILYYMVGIEAIDKYIDVDQSSSIDDGKNTIGEDVTSRYGEKTLPTVVDKNGKSNKFFEWKYDSAKKDSYSFASGNPYIELSGGEGGATRGFNALVENEFITWDFEIANSNGAYPSYAGLHLMVRPKTQSANFATYAYTDVFGELRGNTLTIGGASYKLPETPYEWTHVTLVLEIDYSGSYVKDDVTYYPNLYKSLVHFYVNGIHKSSTKIFNNDNIRHEDGLVRTSEFSLTSFRFKLLPSGSINKDASTSICLDNSIITYYPRGYEGDINEVIKDKSLNLNEASDVVYKNGYYVPGQGALIADDRRIPVAEVDGIKYYDMDEALAAISDGSVAYIYQDVEAAFNVNSSFTIYTAKEDGKSNYRFNVVSDGYYLSEIRENGNLLGYRTAPTNKFVTVFWQVNTGYETRVPLGVIPEYDGIMPSPKIDSLGRSFSLIGWSSERNATEPEALGSITKDDVAKGYKIYYPVYAPTKVLVSFVDEAGNELYSDFYGEGEIPECDVNKYFDGYEDNGRYISPTGWSTNKLASAPDTIPAITANDILTGKIVYHPIKGISKVKVTFLDEKQSPIKSEWISVGTPIEELKNYIPEASFPIKIDSTNSYFNFDYSGWLLESGMSTVGADPVNAIPQFDNPILKDVKYSYTIQRFTEIAPKLFVNVPDLTGYSKDGVELISNANNGQGKATVGGVEYNVLDGTKYTEFVTTVAENSTLTLYIHFKYDGEAYIQSVDLSFNDYLENSIEDVAEAGENENTLKVLMETVRLAETYAKLSKKETLPVCKKYLSDENFTKYLYDYTKVSSLISEDKKEALETNLDGLFSHFERNVRWDFVSNKIYISPITSVHPNITNGYNKDANLGDFLHASTNNRAFTYLYKTDSNYVYYSAEGAKPLDPGTLRGGIQGTYEIQLKSATYGIQTFSAISNGTSDRINIKFQSEGDRIDMFNHYYSISCHILELERRIEAGGTGLEEELKMAQIIYSTQYSYMNVVEENNVRDLDFSKLWK